MTSVSKALAQRLEGWKCVLGQYRYTICHILGGRNAWGDLLSRWVSVPALPVRAVAVFSPCDQDGSMRPKAAVRQAKALATDGTEVQSYESAVVLAVLDDEGLFRIHASGRHVLWIPDSDKQVQVLDDLCARARRRASWCSCDALAFARVLCLVRCGGSDA